MATKNQIGLEDAYSLETPEDNKALYKSWASSYDSVFVKERAYNFPKHIASLFSSIVNPYDVPVLDVGAGTGLVAQELLSFNDLLMGMLVLKL